MRSVRRHSMHPPARLSLLISAAICAIGLIDNLLRVPDTMNGTVIPWDALLKVSFALYIAALAFVGSLLGLRWSGARQFSYSAGFLIVVLYAAYFYLPQVVNVYVLSRASQVVTLSVDGAGRISTSGALVWPLLEPLVMPFLLAFV